jgi:hypothetical protein
MQAIQFFNSNTSTTGCLTAVAPVTYQSDVLVKTGTGSTGQDLLAVLPSGEPAAFGGQIINTGCFGLLATIFYLEGDDCDTCTTPDTLTVVKQQIKVPKATSFPIPDGFYTQINFQTIDVNGNPVDVTAEQTVSLYSSYKPNCPTCKVLVP